MRKSRIKGLILIHCLLLSLSCFAQTPVMDWARTFGSAAEENPTLCKLDPFGNLYSLGYFEGTVDFDPGIGVTNLTSNGIKDIYIQKFNAAGDLLWAKNIGGSSWDIPNGISFDNAGNIHVTGYYIGTVDFDPGIGVSNLVSVGADDAFVFKWDPTGNFIWAKSFGGTSQERGYALEVDNLGNVYSVGTFFSWTADLDPGAAVYNLTGTGTFALYVSKLDSNGDFVWAKPIISSSYIYPNQMGVNSLGEIVITGRYSGTCDMNPGAPTNAVSSNGQDGFILKLTNAGDYSWAYGFGSSGIDEGKAMTIDNSNSIYVTGYFENTVDFNFGAGTNTHTSLGARDIFILKIDNSGSYNWSRSFGSTSIDVPFGIALDPSNSVYSTGYYGGSTDFDPGAGVYSLGGSLATYVQKLDNAGNFSWAIKLGGGGLDGGVALDVDNNGHVYSTGYFSGVGQFNPYGTSYTVSSSGSKDVYVHKIIPTCLPTTLTADVTNLPNLTYQCWETITLTPPTATTDCGVSITATTTNPTPVNPGNYTITWNYDTGSGLTSTQTQSVVIQGSSSWSYVGQAGFTANVTTNQSMDIDPNGIMYVAYVDPNNSSKLSVKKYDGTTWNLVGSAGFTVENVTLSSIKVNSAGVPYVAYRDPGNSNVITVKQFDGSNWISLGGALEIPGTPFYDPLAFDNNDVPYVVFKDAYNGQRISVKKHNGTNWVYVGNAGFSSGFIGYESITFDQVTNEPYVAYVDVPNGAKLSVQKFNGTSWGYVGNQACSPGGVSYVNIEVPNGTPYVAFLDATQTSRTSVMSFNGSSWDYVGSAGFSNGGYVEYIDLEFTSNNIPVICYQDQSFGMFVRRFDGVNWVNLGTASGISPSSGTYMELSIHNDELFVVCRDNANGAATSVFTYNECNGIPTALCQNITLYLGANGTVTLTPYQVNNGSSTTSGSLALGVSVTSFNCSNIGQNAVVLTATSGTNSSTCTATVTIVDALPPTATSPSALSVACIGDVPAANTADVTNVQDNCSTPVVTFVGDVSDGLSNPETITRTYSVTDGSGNASAVTQTITVLDTQAPTATSPSAIAVACIGDVPAPNTADVTNVQDNCSTPVVTFVGDVSDGLSNPETITRTYSVTDGSGNASAVTQTITVLDTQAPTATSPSAISVACIGDVPAPNTADVTNVQDNCSTPVVTFVGDVSDGLSNPETITRTYSVTDGSGNASAVTQTITVLDTQAPTATSPSAIAVSCVGDVPAANTADVTNVQDNCSTPVVTFVGDVSDGLSNPETITRTYSVTDGSGNASAVTQTITVEDLIAPIPTTATLADLLGECSIASPTPPTAIDNCGGTLIGVPDVSFPITNNGLTVITWTFDDGNGNTSQQTQNATNNPIAFITTITQTGTTLTADETNATYQWVDCGANFAPIQGAIAQSFSPTVAGQYAVELSRNGCTETTSCIMFGFSGIAKINTDPLVLYPNPTNALITVETTSEIQSVLIYNLAGSLVQTENTNHFSVERLSSGVYLIHVHTTNGLILSRFIKE